MLTYLSAPDRERSIVMSASVCLCVSVCLYIHDHIFGTTKFFLHLTYCRGSVLLWRHSDTLCTSVFTDDVIFAHKASRRPAEAQCTRSIGIGYKLYAVIPVAGHRTHRGSTFRAPKVTFQVATLGAESAVHDSLVSTCERCVVCAKKSV